MSTDTEAVTDEEVLEIEDAEETEAPKVKKTKKAKKGKAAKKPAKMTAVPFKRMTCPVEGCDLQRGGGPREGSIPGIRRHVKKMHPEFDVEDYAWPELH